MISKIQSINPSGSVVALGLRWPKLVILAAVWNIPVLGALIYRANINTDLEKKVPIDDPARVLNRSMRWYFGTPNILIVSIVEEAGVLTG